MTDCTASRVEFLSADLQAFTDVQMKSRILSIGDNTEK
jgi:hypothetical protein